MNMSPLEIWLTIVGISFATLVTRAGFHMTNADVRLSPRLESALRYAPACALVAIIVPDLIVRNDEIFVSLSNARLLAGCVSVAVFLVTRSVLGTIAGGMGAFWLLGLWV
jgi:branched-subunit amino acid transport protein